MKVIELIFLAIAFLNPCESWEYCQADIQNKLCEGAQSHMVCDGKNSIPNVGIV